MIIGLVVWATIIGVAIWITWRLLPNNPATVSSLRSWNKMLLQKEVSDEDYWKLIEEIARNNKDGGDAGYGYELILQYVEQRKAKNSREYFLPRS